MEEETKISFGLPSPVDRLSLSKLHTCLGFQRTWRRVCWEPYSVESITVHINTSAILRSIYIHMYMFGQNPMVDSHPRKQNPSSGFKLSLNANHWIWKSNGWWPWLMDNMLFSWHRIYMHVTMKIHTSCSFCFSADFAATKFIGKQLMLANRGLSVNDAY